MVSVHKLSEWNVTYRWTYPGHHIVSRDDLLTRIDSKTHQSFRDSSWAGPAVNVVVSNSCIRCIPDDTLSCRPIDSLGSQQPKYHI
jgi:hypothetical protein